MNLDFEKNVSEFAWDYFNNNANKKQVYHTYNIDININKCYFSTSC